MYVSIIGVFNTSKLECLLNDRVNVRGWLGSAVGAIVIVKLRVIEVCLKLKIFEIDINGKSFRICLSE